jgi:hypothetical protein
VGNEKKMMMMVKGETPEDSAADTSAAPCPHRHGDDDCRARACRFFTEVVGAWQGLLRWDERHLLQAHAHVGDRDYVLIAARDEEHEPVLLDKDDWDHVSHTFGPERGALLRSYAIRAA